ncbi:hypothetical protein E8P77_12035 [Soehngenia saccharolytica]|nr:hypothetical protein E8P77_12035 [Soehngenia saccharolytica]
MLIAVIVLTGFIVIGCTNQNPPDENIELPEGTDQQVLSDDQLVQYEGKIAIITEDVVLKDPYVITVDTNDNNIYQTLENEEFQLNKNDMVIVIEENGNEKGLQDGIGIVLERKEDWVRMSMPMQESDL